VSKKPLRVLIVEDSPGVRQALKTLISEIKGLALVGCARDVPQGRDALRQLSPDIVILDIQLPGGSGLDLLKALGKSEPKPPMVIVFSGADARYRHTCLEMGADCFFDKPLELAMLEDLLRKLTRPEI
jgi:DNA-binding NarL/FixJ family response regulator